MGGHHGPPVFRAPLPLPPCADARTLLRWRVWSLSRSNGWEPLWIFMASFTKVVFCSEDSPQSHPISSPACGCLGRARPNGCSG